MPKRGRKAPKNPRPTKRATVVDTRVLFPGPGRQQQLFVPRSFGNPRAITERKYFTSLRAAASITALSTDWASTEVDPATLNTLFAPTTGDDYLNRDGRKIQLIALKIRGTIAIARQTDQSTADGSQIIRVLLVQDRQTNAAQLNGEDVMQGQASAVINTFQNPAFFGRFRVWKDKQWSFMNPTISWDGTNMEQSGMHRQFKWNIKFKKPITIHYNATNGGTVADVVDHSFHIIAGAGSTDMPATITYVCRATFIDL